MAIQRPTGKYLNPGSNTNKMNKALQKPKITIVSSSDKTYMENQRLEKMKNARKTGGINTPQVQPVYRNQNGVTGTGTATGSSQPTAAMVARWNKMNKYKMGNR